MAITATPRFGLVQWGAGSDSPSRTTFNATLAAIDSKAAYDDGAASTSALPTSNVVDGRYAGTVSGAYRKLYRRAAGVWTQVGGNTWEETTYARADTGLPTSGAARIVSHPNLTNPTVTENWDGSSTRGGRQAIGDLNSGQPGALHVGDTGPTTDLVERGRVYVRSTANNHRGFVASAHATGAGNLFSAIEPGNSVPWSVDAQGRMRSTAPTSFGGNASPVVGVPISVVASASASDLSAMDLTANTGKPALRVFHSTGDSSTPIASFAQTSITLGRASWATGLVSVLGPGLTVANTLTVNGATHVNDLDVGGDFTVDDLNVGGALDVNGATVLAGLTAGTTTLAGLTATAAATLQSTLKVNGTTTLAALTAAGAATLQSTLKVNGTSDLAGVTAGSTSVSSLTSSGNVTASSGTVRGSLLQGDNGLTLHGGGVTSSGSASSAQLLTRPPSQQGSGSFSQSVRQPMVYTFTYEPSPILRIETTSSGSGAATSIRTVTMPEDGWMRLDADLLFTGDIGAVGAEAEIFKVFINVELVSSSGTLLETSQQYVSAFTSDAPERNKQGMGMTHITEVWPRRLTAGSYQIRLRMYKQGALSGEFTRATYTIQPVVLHAAST